MSEGLSPIVMSDRRKASRAKAVLMIGRIDGAHCDDVCLVRDISPTGVQIRSRYALRPGDRLALQLGAENHARGVVRWVRDGLAGIEFERHIVVDTVLKPARIGKARRIYPRFHRCARVVLTAGSLRFPGELLNISPGGIALRVPRHKGFAAGVSLSANVDGLAPYAARIQWIGDEFVGLAYEKPLQLWDLQRWLEASSSACRTCRAKICVDPAAVVSESVEYGEGLRIPELAHWKMV